MCFFCWDDPFHLNFRNNFLQMDIFYQELSYEEVQQNVAFAFLSLLGEIGGFLGLLLGASVLTVCELLDFVAMTLMKKLSSDKVTPILYPAQKGTQVKEWQNLIVSWLLFFCLHKLLGSCTFSSSQKGETDNDLNMALKMSHYFATFSIFLQQRIFAQNCIYVLCDQQINSHSLRDFWQLCTRAWKCIMTLDLHLLFLSASWCLASSVPQCSTFILQVIFGYEGLNICFSFAHSNDTNHTCQHSGGQATTRHINQNVHLSGQDRALYQCLFPDNRLCGLGHPGIVLFPGHGTVWSMFYH